ncbi:protein disulfide-isomerase precursor [Thecaphora frezii]
MRFARTAIAAAGLASAATAYAAEASSSSDVVVLAEGNFTSWTESEPLALVEFYAPWCGHCKNLAPQYEEAATTLKDASIKLAKVDCTAETEICSKMEVSGYPTLKINRKGAFTEYNGPRKADGIVSYMQKQSLPALSKLSADNIAEFKGKDKVVAITYLSEKDTEDLDVITKVAEAHRDNYLFGVTHDEALAKAAGVTAPALVLYRQFDEPEVKFDKKINEDDIVSFLKVESVPLVDELGPENFMVYAGSGLPLAYLFADPASKDLQSQIDVLKPIAKANKGKLNFVWIDGVKFANHAKSLNIQGDELPAFAIQDIENNLKFPLEDIASDLTGKITAFVNKYTTNELKPSVKSEAIPADQDGPVFVLVADEFEKVVGDDSKDKLVEFYAPWCGHCKNLAPTYDQLGEKYSAHKDKVLIAKMDATLNDVPPSAGFQIQSFPTIKFKAAGSSDWIDFDGDRSLEGFVEFISQKGTHKLSVDLEPVNETATDAKKDEAPHHEEL